jgi:FkbM family methyltransferase
VNKLLSSERTFHEAYSLASESCDVDSGMTVIARRPNTLESLLLKPYFWRRPSQLARRIRQSFTPPASEAVVALPWGLEIDCSPCDMIGGSLVRTGVFELATTEALVRLTDPGDLALDVGANIGYMTSVLARAVGPAGRVIAYEPNPLVYDRLSRNVRRWQGKDLPPIDSRPVAVSDQAGVAQLSVPDGGHEWATIGERPTERAPGELHRTVTVPTVTLDDELAKARVGVMKLDVEDHEPAALRGSRLALEEGRIRDIVFEDGHAYPTETTTILEGHGYTVFDLAQKPFGIALHGPQAHVEHVSWDGPTRLATLDVSRARRNLSKPGWEALRARPRTRSR